MTKDQRNMTQEEGRRTQEANQGQQTPASGAAAQTDNEVVELVGVDEAAGQGGSGRILLGDALQRLRDLEADSVDTVSTDSWELRQRLRTGWRDCAPSWQKWHGCSRRKVRSG